jgi:hypothetical protein
MIILFSYIVVFTQQHMNNLTSSDKNSIKNILKDKEHHYERVTARIT